MPRPPATVPASGCTSPPAPRCGRTTCARARSSRRSRRPVSARWRWIPAGRGWSSASTTDASATIDLDEIGPDAAAAGVTPLELAHVAGPVDRLFVTDDGTTIVAGQGDHLDVIDAVDGSLVGGLDLHGVADLADGGTGDALEATLADVTDPSAEASDAGRAARRGRRLVRGQAALERRQRGPRRPGRGRHADLGRDRDQRRTTGRDRHHAGLAHRRARRPTGSRSSTRRAPP